MTTTISRSVHRHCTTWIGAPQWRLCPSPVLPAKTPNAHVVKPRLVTLTLYFLRRERLATTRSVPCMRAISVDRWTRAIVAGVFTFGSVKGFKPALRAGCVRNFVSVASFPRYALKLRSEST